MAKFKAEIKLTITYEGNPKLYPKGNTPEDCLRMDLAKFRDNPEYLLGEGEVQVKGRIIDVYA